MVRPEQMSPARAPICAEACLLSIRIGRATTRPASARESGASSATGRSIGPRGGDRGPQVPLVVSRPLPQWVVAADQVRGAVVAERGDDLLDLLAHRLE